MILKKYFVQLLSFVLIASSPAVFAAKKNYKKTKSQEARSLDKKDNKVKAKQKKTIKTSKR